MSLPSMRMPSDRQPAFLSHAALASPLTVRFAGGSECALPPRKTDTPTAGRSMQTAICSFDSRADAERAADLLVQRGLRRDFVYMKAGQPAAHGDGTASEGDRRTPGFFHRLFTDLFGDAHASTKAGDYDDAVARG